MSLFDKLLRVQLELKAPKGQYNSFGKYKYRSCEDIVEALKPLLAQNQLFLSMSDEIVALEGRYYIKATVAVTDIETGEKHEVFGWAREEETKKGMDGSQITGASSSYARKYALNGMFAIDDTKDSDSTNTGNGYSPAKKRDDKPAKTSNKSNLIEQVYAAGEQKGLGKEDTEIFLAAAYNVDKLSAMTMEQLNQAIEAFGKRTSEQIMSGLLKLKGGQQDESA